MKTSLWPPWRRSAGAPGRCSGLRGAADGAQHGGTAQHGRGEARRHSRLFPWAFLGKTMGKHGKTEASTWILWKILGILEKLWKTDGLKLFEHQNGHGWRFKDRLTCLLLVLIMMNHDSSGIFIDDHGFRWLKQAISCQISSVWWIRLRMMFGGFIKKWMNMTEPRNLLPSTVHAQF